MKTKIFFSNNQDKYEITPELKRLLAKAVHRTLKSESFPDDAEVSLSFVDNEEIHALNLEHRGIDRPTDVLSFPILDGDEDTGDVDMNFGAVLLGDIIISVERALEQAEEYGHSIERELAFLSVHSVLHLLGYDHEKSLEEEKTMFQKQEDVLVSIGLKRG